MPKQPMVKACPRCGQRSAVVPIVYGMPTQAIAAEAQRGEVALGGDDLLEDEPMPMLRCTRCALDFDHQVVQVHVE